MPVKSYFISTATLKIVNESMNYYIHFYAKEYNVEKALIHAIVRVETGKMPTAIRYEEHLSRQTWYTRWLSKEEIQDKYAYCSMGPMQILFAVAVSYGYKGTPFELLNPKNAIGYGALHLKKLLDKYKTMPEAVSAYNQGNTRKRDGEFRNQKYVDDVIRAYMKYSKVKKKSCSCLCKKP